MRRHKNFAWFLGVALLMTVLEGCGAPNQAAYQNRQDKVSSTVVAFQVSDSAVHYERSAHPFHMQLFRKYCRR